jgi:hypothetical protein
VVTPGEADADLRSEGERSFDLQPADPGSGASGFDQTPIDC